MKGRWADEAVGELKVISRGQLGLSSGNCSSWISKRILPPHSQIMPDQKDGCELKPRGEEEEQNFNRVDSHTVAESARGPNFQATSARRGHPNRVRLGLSLVWYISDRQLHRADLFEGLYRSSCTEYEELKPTHLQTWLNPTSEKPIIPIKPNIMPIIPSPDLSSIIGNSNSRAKVPPQRCWATGKNLRLTPRLGGSVNELLNDFIHLRMVIAQPFDVDIIPS